MNVDKQKFLINSFPTIYREPNGIGFSCWDGWYEIIYNLSKKLENISVTQLQNEQLKIIQIKQKFAALRVYVMFSTKEADILIKEADDLSVKTCEWCGYDGSFYNHNGMYFTLCDNHVYELQAGNLHGNKK